MRVKTFTGQELSEAIGQVRSALGENAVILSTVDSPEGFVQVTAACEEEPSSLSAQRDTDSALDKIAQALEAHRLPSDLRAEILQNLDDAPEEDSILALATSLDALFSFSTLSSKTRANSREESQEAQDSWIVLGPPGVGKTLAAAKLAMHYRMEDTPVVMVTLDGEKAGALVQARTFAMALGADLEVCPSLEALPRVLEGIAPESRVVIDVPGIHHREEDRIVRLGATIQSLGLCGVAVLPGGMDSLESRDWGASLAAAGAEYLLPVHLDTSRRYGGLLTAAKSGSLQFLAGGAGAMVGTGLADLTPISMARLLLRPFTQRKHTPSSLEKRAENG